MADLAANGAANASAGTDPNESGENGGESDQEKALGGRLRKLEDKLEKRVNRALEAALGPITATLTKLGEQMAEREQAAGQGASAGSNAGASDSDPKLAGALKRIDELTRKHELAEARAKEIEAASRKKERDQRLNETVMTALAASGIEGTRAKHAAKIIIGDHADYESDDADDIIFKGKRPEDSVDFETGFSGWMKTDDAKIFLPPRGASGSGDRGGGRATSGGKKGALQPGDLGRMLLDAANQVPSSRE